MGQVVQGSAHPRESSARSSAGPKAADHAPRQSARSGQGSSRRGSQSAESDGGTVQNRFANDKHFKSSVQLRSVRSELLRVREKLRQ
jgi:hypothetical protein